MSLVNFTMALKEDIPEKPSGSAGCNRCPSLLNEKTESSQILSIFPGSAKSLSSTANSTHLQWYSRWLDQQLKNVPPFIVDRLECFPTTFLEIAKFAKGNSSIDDIATSLLQSDLIKVQDAGDGREAARTLVFAILGWQTMLYAPAFGTCPPQQLSIVDVLGGYTGQAFMTLKQDHSRIACCLPDFLLGFGLMLPRENLCISEDPEDCQAFEKVAIVNPAEFNASLLRNLARINIQWVDVMAPHLEFDKATNTLFLFRYPSFCIANIPSNEDPHTRGVIHGCAARADGMSQWASETEVTQLLYEILLSYRLLFGQTKDSRRLFQSMKVFEGEPIEAHDPLLPLLCGSKTIALPTSCKEREFYRLSRDFPILRSRIASLQQQMSILKPRGWREIWQDKRDSAQWYTFWAVIAIGGSGILLSLIQVILQAAQLAGAH
ncbi:hypothetical protein GP486_000747 [Trichoglossum hirsutum]|uniref:Uncharacterized protein n=1 Tax=Trichoglossum hirsutum TaxID=265104 RepID=A0A9P8LI70_9PEZI|nr:hypothetical protein GP486_000747 [Trichoglossum hirsutum]